MSDLDSMKVALEGIDKCLSIIITERDKLKIENHDLLVERVLWNKYVELLCAELNDVVGIAHVHGWVSHRFEEGRALRQALGLPCDDQPEETTNDKSGTS